MKRKRRTKLSLLYTCDFDIFVVEKCSNFTFRSVDGVGVELENSRDGRRRRRRRTRAMRTRVGVDAGDEKEDEDEEARKTVSF